MANIVQVFGPGRTGTTMMHLMLGNAPDAFAIGEIYSMSRPWRTHHFRPECSCGKSYDECIWRKFEHVDERDLHKKLGDRGEVTWVVDESKNLRWIMDADLWAKRNNMPVFYILMMKSLSNLMYSLSKRGMPLDRAINNYVTYYERAIHVGVPFVTVSLEELTRDPASKLAKVCKLIGMPFFEGKERFWEKQHCHLFGSLGVRRAMQHPETMQIYPDSGCPNDFKEKARAAIEVSGKAERIKQIQDYLEQQEVDRIQQYNAKATAKRYTVKPLWYYKNWVRSEWMRRFPQEWPHSQ